MRHQKRSLRNSLFIIMLSVVSLIFLLPTTVAAGNDVIELKFAHQNPPRGRTTVKFLDPWMKKVEEATKGRVKITSYPAQSLCKAEETFAAVEGGVADMGWVTMGYFAGRFPLTDVMTLPFIPKPDAKTNSRVLQELFETTPAMQRHFSTIKLLFLHTSDPYMLATTKKPVRNLEDLKGMKVRALGALPADAFRRLGASPISMPMPALYESAEKGVLDGAALPWAAVDTWRFWEVFDYWTDVSTWTATFFVIMNKDTWERLPADIQAGIMSVSGVYGAEFAAVTGWGPDIYDEVVEKMKTTSSRIEKVELDPGEYARWKKQAGEPVWDQWAETMEKRGLPGKEVLKKALDLLDKY
jgi:TRAP-type transport system periplasmic protein